MRTAGLLYGVAVALFLSMHAVERMRARGIARSEVEEGLSQRETTYQSADDPSATVVLCSTAAGRKLKVVVATEDEEYIITVAVRAEE